MVSVEAGIILVMLLLVLLSPIIVFILGCLCTAFVRLVGEIFYEWMCANRAVYRFIKSLWEDE